MAVTSSIARRRQGCRGLLRKLLRKSIIEAKASTVTCLAICTRTGNATVQLAPLALACCRKPCWQPEQST